MLAIKKRLPTGKFIVLGVSTLAMSIYVTIGIMKAHDFQSSPDIAASSAYGRFAQSPDSSGITKTGTGIPHNHEGDQTSPTTQPSTNRNSIVASQAVSNSIAAKTDPITSPTAAVGSQITTAPLSPIRVPSVTPTLAPITTPAASQNSSATTTSTVETTVAAVTDTSLLSSVSTTTTQQNDPPQETPPSSSTTPKATTKTQPIQKPCSGLSLLGLCVSLGLF